MRRIGFTRVALIVGIICLSAGMVSAQISSESTSVTTPSVSTALDDPLQALYSSTMPEAAGMNLETMTTPYNVGGDVADPMTFNTTFPPPPHMIGIEDMLRTSLISPPPPMMQRDILVYQRRAIDLRTRGFRASPGAPADSVMSRPRRGNTTLSTRPAIEKAAR